MHSKKFLIAGTGPVGLFTAFFLNEAGAEVVMLEKGDGPSGASTGNAGMIVPSHFMPLAAPGAFSKAFKWLFDPESPFYIKPRIDSRLMRWGWLFLRASRSRDMQEKMSLLNTMNVESAKLYRAIIEKENLNVNYKPDGLVMYCKTKEAFDEEVHIAMQGRNLGQEVHVLNPKEALELNPGLELDIYGAIYYPNDAFLTPHLLVEKMATLLIKKGVEIHHKTGVTSLQNKNGYIGSIVAGNREFTADEYILSAGAWTDQLLAPLGIDLPLQAGKGYSVTLSDPPVMPRICSILVEARVAVTPMQHGLRFGGTMEMAGMDERITMSRVQGMFKSIPGFFPQFSLKDFQDQEVWHGFRPCSADGLPYVGRVEKYSNLSVATGHAMMGLSLGPVTGKYMTEQLLKGMPLNRHLKVQRYG